MVNDTTLGIIVLAILLLAAIGITVFSVVFMSRESQRTAEINKQAGQPVSNGYATVALIAVLAVFALTVVFGLLPPILRR